MEVNTISEAKAFADELKKALEGTDKNVTVNVNINVGERVSKKSDMSPKVRRLSGLNTITHARPYPRIHVDKETGKVTTETITTGTPAGLSDTYTTSSGWRDVTHKCKKDIDSSCKCKSDSERIYRPDVNRRNACRRRAARRFEEKREQSRKEMLRKGLADCKITPCKTPVTGKSGAKSYHKKFVDDNGNVITVNYTCNDNPTAEDIAELHRKMNAMLREFPFFW